MRNPAIVVLAVVMSLCLLGCQKRSISDSGYRSNHGFYHGGHSYSHEISEFDVLGIDNTESYTQEQIRNAFNEHPINFSLNKGQRILLVQSGAQIPDSEMTMPLNKHFDVQAFNGEVSYYTCSSCNRPSHDQVSYPRYANTLRMAAAKAGINTIMVYWGTLESEIQNHETKAVSWVPLAGMIVPDETQHMRIRLKVALIDVKSGQWQMFTPAVHKDQSLSASLNRAASDQKQVEKLKTLAYAGAVEELVKRYGE